MNDAGRWAAAAADARIASDLQSIYVDVDRAVQERGPTCWASGRCCRFEEVGHLLYVTGLEAAYAADWSARAARERAGRAKAAGPESIALPQLSASRVADSMSVGDCPFLQANLCGARAFRPLGCRVYFCDRSATEWQQALYERGLERIRSLHERWELPYVYGEWRLLLGAAVDASIAG